MIGAVFGGLLVVLAVATIAFIAGKPWKGEQIPRSYVKRK